LPASIIARPDGCEAVTKKIGIVGLGQIGASVGLALKRRSGLEPVVGHDRDPKVARTAERLGAVDSSERLTSLASEASIIFLCLPLAEIGEVLKAVGPRLSEGAIVLDTAPAKQPVLEWFREFVPEGRHYLGLVPAVGTPFLAAAERGVNGADPDLFRRSVMIVVTPPETPADVEQAGVNLATLLGAKPMLTDLAESDGIMATAHLLPQLAAAALVEASVSAPGWAEARKLAGAAFAGVTGGLGYYDDPKSIEVAALASKPSVVHGLDVLIAALNGMRDDIKNGDRSSVIERLEHSFHAREQWLDQRGQAAWLSEGGDTGEVPKLGDQMMQSIFGGRIVDRLKGTQPPHE
jgi:prephenate dehydrogenase